MHETRGDLQQPGVIGEIRAPAYRERQRNYEEDRAGDESVSTTGAGIAQGRSARKI